MASGSRTSSTDEVDRSIEDVNDKRSLLRTVIRYIMRTFYDSPLSCAVEYIYYHECINLNDLAGLLQLNPKEVYSYIEQFKRDQFIIEEHRGESKNKFDPTTLYYKIDIVSLINVIQYRLVRMQLETEEFEQVKPMLYKCEECSNEYNEFDVVKLFQASLGEDLRCPYCPGRVKEKSPTEQDSMRCDMRLFNEQLKLLFQTLEKIEQIAIDELATTIEKVNDKYVLIMDTDAMDLNDKAPEKPLPEWFTRSISRTSN